MRPIGARWHELFAPPETETAIKLGVVKKASGALARMLFSGQGMTNFIQVYETGQKDKQPSGTALLDFGQGNSSQGDAINKICDTLEAMGNVTGRDARIDLVVISHQDKDHWGLINGFVAECKERLLVPTIGQISIGGTDWGKSAKEAVENLADYAGVGYTSIPASCCDYDDPKAAKGTLYDIGGVKFRVLACNIALEGVVTRSIARNATSAMVVLEFDGFHMIFPGDATYQTMDFVNEKLKQWKTKNPVRPCFVLGAPHHGSLTTFAKNSSDLAIGAEFAKLVQAQNLVASAGSLNNHHHPQLVVLDVFKKWLEPATAHTIVAFNNEPTVNAYEEISRKESTYTTVTALPPNLATKDWMFYLGTIPKAATADADLLVSQTVDE